jgi:hypothetical protein
MGERDVPYGFVRNYEYESEAPQIATKAVSTEIKVTITK